MVITTNLLPCAIIFFIVILCSLVSFLLTFFMLEKYNSLEVFSLYTSGSTIILAILFVLTSIAKWQITVPIIILITISSIVISMHIKALKNVQERQIQPERKITLVMFFVIFVSLLVTKLAYIKGLQLPLNTDSVIHVNQINTIISTKNILQLPYYHYAFHHIVIVIDKVTGIGIGKTILLFGQVLQVLIPISLFFPVYAITKNVVASMIALASAGFCWGMPSEATSWGKYPALLAMASFVFVFFMLHQFYRKRNIFQFLITLPVLITCVYMHSRMLIMILLGIISFHVSSLIENNKWFQKNQSKFRILILCLYCIIVITSFFPQLKLLHSAFIPYHSPMLVPLLLLLPCSLTYYSKEISTIALFTLITIFVSIFPLPSHGFFSNINTLIDRPFLSIFLFIPLSITLGLNIASVENFLYSKFGKKSTNMLLVLLLLPILLTPNKKVIEPLPDVNFVTIDDLFLFQQIIKKTALDSKILIPSHTPYYELGLDGGAWIEYSTGRNTIKLSYDSNLNTSFTHQFLCDTGTEYVYSGNNQFSFSTEQLDAMETWYRPFIYYPDVKLYQVINCPK